MRLAVLGTDSDILALVTAAKTLGHDVVWLGDVRPVDATALAPLVPSSLALSANWETLLDQATADAVLIGRGTAASELRAEQLKRLATDAVPMLVVHPICDSVLTYYEVDMIRREARGLVQHYHPLNAQPVVEALANWVAELAGENSSLNAAQWINPNNPTIDGVLPPERLPRITPIHQVSFERCDMDTSRSAVLRHLARDAEMIAAILGPIRRVTAVGPHLSSDSYASLQVQLAAFGPQSIRWSVTPHATRGPGVKVTFIGDREIVTLRAIDSSADPTATAWTIEEDADDARPEMLLPTFDAPAGAINKLALALAERDPELRTKSSTWDRATQSMEVLDAIELSLQKGRTMEVHQQQLTEQLAFRGTMAALGCGLLLVAFAAFLFATLVGGVEAVVDKKLIPSWPVALLALLAVFLLLQALPFLIPKNRRRREQDDTDATAI